ncbi:hypothetical protein HYX04_00640 [Candidatus Woesearchaeota archaeon]|nr:hypothetical protein [Candidatus Woesearchaeota archaeon]
MLFFKPKRKPEIVPPPPPLDFEEELKEKPKFFDEIIKPKSDTFTEQDEFNRLVKELNEGLKPLPKKVSIISKKKGLIKSARNKISEKFKNKALRKQKISKKEIKKSWKTAKKRVQSKSPMQTGAIKQPKRQKAGLPEEDFDLENTDFELPKELEKIEFPETLGDFGSEKGFEQKSKPKEILEAEEEIQSAIEKIKKKEKPSLFNRLFARKEKERKPEESYPTFRFHGEDKLSIIQSDIRKARDALMRFDLETAKRSYIEAMGLYNSISPEEKAKVYQDIKDLYFERKNAEELKV